MKNLIPLRKEAFPAFRLSVFDLLEVQFRDYAFRIFLCMSLTTNPTCKEQT